VVGRKHLDGCDVERCPHCGGQALGCVGFDPSDPRREPWTDKWPGEADCERLGFFVGGDRSLPDINRLFAECRWNAEAQRWEHDPPAGLILLPRLIAVLRATKTAPSSTDALWAVF
jgi:hypothetical protein